MALPVCPSTTVPGSHHLEKLPTLRCVNRSRCMCAARTAANRCTKPRSYSAITTKRMRLPLLAFSMTSLSTKFCARRCFATASTVFVSTPFRVTQCTDSSQNSRAAVSNSSASVLFFRPAKSAHRRVRAVNSSLPRRAYGVLLCIHIGRTPAEVYPVIQQILLHLLKPDAGENATPKNTPPVLG